MKELVDRGIDRGHRAPGTANRGVMATGLGEGDKRGEQGMN